MTQNQSTMRPLLTRLRDRPKDHLLLHEAADEIERLTAALATCQTYDYRTLVDEIERLTALADVQRSIDRNTAYEADIERLRVLLVAACERDGGGCAFDTDEARRDPCTPENCSTARRAHET